MTRHAGIKLTDLELRITNRFLYVPNQHLFNFFTNHMFPKRIIKFLKLTQLRRKKQPKRDLLSSLLSLLIELVFFIELALQHHFNHKKGISSVSILLLLFWFSLWHACLNDLPFLRCKEQREERKEYYWRRKIKQMLCKESYHIISLFDRNS